MSNQEELDNYPDKIESVLNYIITPGQAPERIDHFLTRAMANSSRTKIQEAIENGSILVNGLPTKVSKKIQPGDEIVCTFLKPPPIELIPQDIPLDIHYEDEYLLVVNKPAGMCSHPGFGNRYGTLVNAVLYHFGLRESIAIEADDEEEESEGGIYSGDEIRPGIVHRLDKDTSGLLVIAKNPVVHADLSEQFRNRTTEREYNALVWGKPKEAEGTIDTQISRSPRDRKLFCVSRTGGKRAITDYSVIEEFDYTSLLRFKLHTGRTHQIRVHASYLHHPVFGDLFYGGDKVIYGGEEPRFKRIAEKCIKSVNRQLLHARTLGFTHPVTKEFLRFTADLPADMLEVIEIMRKESEE